MVFVSRLSGTFFRAQMLRRLKRLILWNWWSYFFFSNIARLNYPNLSQIFLRLLDMHHCISIPSYEDFTCAGGAKFMIRKTEGVGGNIVYTGWDSTIFPAKPVSALLSLFFWNFWSWHESISFSVYLFKSLNLPWRLGERCVKTFRCKTRAIHFQRTSKCLLGDFYRLAKYRPVNFR